MSHTAKVSYLGNLRTQVTHVKSGQHFMTDAPTDNNGLGESISPTDMVAAATVSCMITMMGIAARKGGFELGEVEGNVIKEMKAGPRRIGGLKIELHIHNPSLDDSQKQLIEETALSCPVTRSLHPDIAVNLRFDYAD